MDLKVSGKKLIAGVGILLLLGLTAGCSANEKISWKKLAQTHEDLIFGRIPRTGADKAEPVKTGEQPGQTAGKEDADKPGTGGTGEKAQEKKAPAKVKVTLYFANAEGDMLVPEKRTITEVQGIARATLEELIKGPRADKNLAPTIPSGTRLKDIDIRNGVATVDFSREFVDNHWGGSSGELLTVYSVVDVLTQFPTVKEVQFLVEGQKVETLAGHMDLAKPVMRNTEYIMEK